MLTKIMRGFTLIEVMIVVAIIGILAAIAIPNFVRFQCRSKQSEAKTNLKAIYVAQESYRGENDTYLTVADAAFDSGTNELGVQIGGNARYDYATTGAATTFTATATGQAGKDMNGDVWGIDQNNDLSNTTNTCTN